MHKAAAFVNKKIKQPEVIRATEPALDPFPAQQDFLKFRKQRGVNLGSWFVLERWIADRPFRFAQAPASSDFDVARGGHAQQVLDEHWATWIGEQDWLWISQQGINTVRIPIGFYHICGSDASVLHGTEFADLGNVFKSAWGHLLNGIVTANRYGICVLLDLHAAPGKQNSDSHAGTSDPHHRFFESSYYMQHTIHILTVLLTQLTQFTRSFNPPLQNIIGIELLNEPDPGSNQKMLEDWYTDAILSLRSIDPEIPLYIGDCWQTESFTSYISSNSSKFSDTILDHHLYRCFNAEDHRTSAYDHAGRLWDLNGSTRQMMIRVVEKLESAGGGLVVGEWSGALNPQSLLGFENQGHARSQFIKAQVDLYEQFCAGYFFWTYKKQLSGDQGWSFREAVEKGVLPTVGLKAIRQLGEYNENEQAARKSIAKNHAFGQHTSYWAQYPGNYEHWRFENGFNEGWDDAFIFFGSSPPGGIVSELGFKGPWMKRRAQLHVRIKGSGPGLWEFEHGFRQGVDAARRDFAEMCC